MAFVRVYLAPVLEEFVIDPETGDTVSAGFTTDVEILVRGVLGSSVSQVIPSLPGGLDRGKPRFQWALVRCALPALVDHGLMNNKPNIYRFPRLTLDQTFRVVAVPEFNKVRDNLTSRGVDTSTLTRDSTFKQGIELAGRHLEPLWTAENWRLSIDSSEG